MYRFETIIDQKHPIRYLKTLLLNRTIPHALLFTGIEGVGKRLAAKSFAMACNCSKIEPLDWTAKDKIRNRGGQYAQEEYASSCGYCRSCKKIQSGAHPDVVLVKPLSSIIRIAQIRDLCHILSMKPHEARLRVVIISDAQAINPEAGNALLKILEEPPDQTIIILTARQVSDLMPTIVSRCQHIRFNPISGKSIETMLVKQYGLDHSDATIITSMSNGSFSKAISMIKSMNRINWIKLRSLLIKENDFLSLKQTGLIMAFALMLAKDKMVLQTFFEVIKIWIRDLLVYKYDPQKIINKDLTGRIQLISQNQTIKNLLAKMKAVESAQKDIRLNSNIRLTLELLFLRLTNSL